MCKRVRNFVVKLVLQKVMRIISLMRHEVHVCCAHDACVGVTDWRRNVKIPGCA
jgi:hypothetical protein